MGLSLLGVKCIFSGCASRVLIRQTTGQRDYYIDSGAAAVTTGGWSDLIITMTVMSQDS